MLNNIINVDLHIHSIFSKYKEDESIVENSDLKNANTLIEKLEKHNISLFSITDHNRFNYCLYNGFKEKIKENPNSIVKNNLPGVEFDVVLEEGKEKCHIIAIFNDNNDEKVKNIETNIKRVRFLNKPEEFYKIEEFEQILKNIGLEVILIVHQKQALDNQTKSDSLSNSTDRPYYFLKTGYIDCLEYNNPRVEGIVKNSLRDMDLNTPLITGSDCHTWECYPYHSSLNGEKRNFTSFKCLPTFKGLLLSITSFNTRVNRINNKNEHYIKSISMKGNEYPLENGINAIIGDNGSGKSLLLSLLAGQSINYYKQIISENDLKRIPNTDRFQDQYINYIEQGSINKKVKEGKLFDNSDKNYYNDIPNKEIFAQKIRIYFDSLITFVNHNISIDESRSSLKDKKIEIIPYEKNFYYPLIKSEINDEEIDEDEKRRNSLSNLNESFRLEIEENKEYYISLNIYDDLIKIKKSLNSLFEIVNQNYESKMMRNKIRNIIKKIMNNCETDLGTKRSSEEIERTRIVEEYDNFKKNIIDHIKLVNKKNIFPTFPEKMDGFSRKTFKGYEFIKTTLYHDSEVKDDFYKYCFNKNYADEDTIKKIQSKDVLSDALKNYSLKELEEFKKNRLESFISDKSKETTFISEISTNKAIGNTPGENSLVFYKFKIQEESDFNVLLVDQPEDDINPKRINEFLIKYLSSIKDKKQVILVTHNPLLVVNLDVDNVIHLTNKNNIIEVKSGALEYENEKYSILNLIRDNLDGGYEAIERRLKIYERNQY